MTEKQFTFHISEYDEVVITKENDGREFFIGNEDDINIDYIIGLVDLLNEQHEENIELKHDNKRLVKFIMSKGYTLKDYLDWLQKEVWE